MRAAVLYGTAGSLVLTALVTVPAGGAPGPATPRPGAELRGTAVAAAARRGRRHPLRHLLQGGGPPGHVQCGTVKVPLDYAHPDGKQIKLTVSRVKATGKDGENEAEGRRARAPSSTTPAAPAPPACTSR